MIIGTVVVRPGLRVELFLNEEFEMNYEVYINGMITNDPTRDLPEVVAAARMLLKTFQAKIKQAKY